MLRSDALCMYRLLSGRVGVGRDGKVAEAPVGSADALEIIVRAAFVYSWCAIRSDDFPEAMNRFREARLKGASSVNMQLHDVQEVLSGVSRLRAFQRAAAEHIARPLAAGASPSAALLLQALGEPCALRAAVLPEPGTCELSGARDVPCVRLEADRGAGAPAGCAVVSAEHAARLLVLNDLMCVEVFMWDIAHSVMKTRGAGLPPVLAGLGDDDLLRECQLARLAWKSIHRAMVDEWCARLAQMLRIITV